MMVALLIGSIMLILNYNCLLVMINMITLIFYWNGRVIQTEYEGVVIDFVSKKRWIIIADFILWNYEFLFEI